MQNCQYCNVSINETYNFCIDCEKQAKCLKCGSYLLKDKSKCLSCGTLLDVVQINVAPMNTFSLEEEQSDNNYNRKINLAFTDAAIDKVASVLGGYVPLTPPVNLKPVLIQERQSRLSLLPPFQKSEVEESTQDEDTQEKNIDSSIISISESNDASEYFDKDAQGFLVSRFPDYKGKSKKVQQQRFSLLYVWAYYIFFQQPVSKEHLNQAAKINSVYDQNYSNYLGDISRRLFVSIDGAFKLNTGGQLEARKILEEIKDSDLKGIEHWNLRQKASNKRSRTTKDESKNIDDWIQTSSRFDSFDVRNLKTNAEYALLAVYDITKELKVQESVKPGLAYEYLSKRYVTISTNKEKFRKALTNSKDYGKYFSRTSDGSYYLTQEGEITVEGWDSQEINQNQ